MVEWLKQTDYTAEVPAKADLTLNLATAACNLMELPDEMAGRLIKGIIAKELFYYDVDAKRSEQIASAAFAEMPEAFTALAVGSDKARGDIAVKVKAPGCPEYVLIQDLHEELFTG